MSPINFENNNANAGVFNGNNGNANGNNANNTIGVRPVFSSSMWSMSLSLRLVGLLCKSCGGKFVTVIKIFEDETEDSVLR
ncbi:hypothetical protein IJ102_01525 [Candidatus Saccharibacteria bacterium]|nr:hypothetical protein [Candidatus Saccharibacteria bacterium]